MHIPDGYLSPQTTIPAFVAMSVIWYLAYRKVKNTEFANRPLVALCAAFSFVIMMFNVPVTGGSSAHAVGAVLVAILVGPWNAILAISTTLVIQAFVFGDGGLLAIGINCLNMAVIMPISGYAVYRFLTTGTPSNKRSIVAVFIASYIGLNLAALATAIEMGIQPLFFTAHDGTPLYGFYGLNITIPAMMISHLLIAGPLDGLIAATAFGYIQKYAPHILQQNSAGIAYTQSKRNLIVGLALMIILTPLGLLASGTAFGEWGTEEVKEILGYIPAGIEHGANIWHAFIPDYSINFLASNFMSQSFGYILSAIIGVTLISFVILISARISANKDERN